jgi:SAM-dependent methyltransferase
MKKWVDNQHSKLPLWLRQRIRRITHPAIFKFFHHLQPTSKTWGKDRGKPLDRFYIENFLSEYHSDIKGKILEIGGRNYTEMYGKDIVSSDVLDKNPLNQYATIRVDLENAIELPGDTFDCIIFTQVLQFIYNYQNCLRHLHRSLVPGGVLLATIPSQGRIDISYGLDKDYWRFTASACSRIFGDIFGKDNVICKGYGNVYANVIFLEGLAENEVSQQKLLYTDPLFPLLVSVRAVK